MKNQGEWFGWEVWTALAVTALVLGAEWSIARTVNFCGTPDSCAYLALGESLAKGTGFRENFLFQYQWMPTSLPVTGIEYWRPGTSLFLLLAKAFGGVNLHHGLLVTMLAGVVLAAAAWRIAMDAAGSRRIALASYALCLVLPPVWNGALSTDSALFYGAAAAWFLALLRVDFKSYRDDALALACVIVVALVRNDWILLLVPLLVVAAMRYAKKLPRGASPLYLAGLGVGFAGAGIPMLILDRLVLGRFPDTAGTLWLTSLNQLTSYGVPASLHTMLQHGWIPLVKLRLATLPQMLYRLIFVLVGFAVLFVPVLALRRPYGERAKLPELAGGVAFLATILGVYGLVLPAVGGFSALRAFAALLPLTAVLIVAGIVWVDALKTVRRWLFGGVFLIYFLMGVMAARRAAEEANRVGTADRAVANSIRSAGLAPGALIMTKDAAQFSETTGFAAVPLPSNGWQGLQSAVRDWRPARVLVEQDDFDANLQRWRSALHPAAETQVGGVIVLAPDARPCAPCAR